MGSFPKFDMILEIIYMELENGTLEYSHFFLLTPSFSGSIVESGECFSHDVMISGIRRGPKRFGVDGYRL